MDFVVDKGVYARVINVPLKRFALIGATTRAGLLSGPLRNRFGIFHHIDFYPEDELAQIIQRSAKILETKIDKEACYELARRSRGTPRIANRLLRRVRDFSLVKRDGVINIEAVNSALEIEGVDSAGLDNLDVKFLTTIISYYAGGPVGIEAIAATINEEVDTLEEMVEPYLLKIGFLKRTQKGRVVGQLAFDHLKQKPDGDIQKRLL